MKQIFYHCEHCGNLIAMLRDEGVPVWCCGEKMRRLQPNTSQASGEKHMPVWREENGTVHVSVGTVEHPMTQEHFIQWIGLETEHVMQYAFLSPNDKPRAKFAICDGDAVRAVYALCNQHELWRS